MKPVDSATKVKLTLAFGIMFTIFTIVLESQLDEKQRKIEQLEMYITTECE